MVIGAIVILNNAAMICIGMLIKTVRMPVITQTIACRIPVMSPVMNARGLQLVEGSNILTHKHIAEYRIIPMTRNLINAAHILFYELRLNTSDQIDQISTIFFLSKTRCLKIADEI